MSEDFKPNLYDVRAGFYEYVNTGGVRSEVHIYKINSGKKFYGVSVHTTGSDATVFQTTIDRDDSDDMMDFANEYIRQELRQAGKRLSFVERRNLRSVNIDRIARSMPTLYRQFFLKNTHLTLDLAREKDEYTDNLWDKLDEGLSVDETAAYGSW